MGREKCCEGENCLTRASLARVLGPAGSRALIAGLLQEIGLAELRGADDLLKFGEALVARSSDVASIGHTAQVYALLSGATRKTPQPAPV